MNKMFFSVVALSLAMSGLAHADQPGAGYRPAPRGEPYYEGEEYQRPARPRLPPPASEYDMQGPYDEGFYGDQGPVGPEISRTWERYRTRETVIGAPGLVPPPILPGPVPPAVLPPLPPPGPVPFGPPQFGPLPVLPPAFFNIGCRIAGPPWNREIVTIVVDFKNGASIPITGLRGLRGSLLLQQVLLLKSNGYCGNLPPF